MQNLTLSQHNITKFNLLYIYAHNCHVISMHDISKKRYSLNLAQIKVTRIRIKVSGHCLAQLKKLIYNIFSGQITVYYSDII